MPDDLAADRAAVDGRCASSRELFQRVAEVVEDEPVAGDETSPAAVDPPSLRRVPEDQIEDRVQIGLRTGELDAIAGQLERRFEQSRPGQRSVGTVCRLEPGGRA